jgi:phosphonate transport system ATP-binding protein
MLTIEHLNKIFPDGTHAVNDVNLTVREGEWVALVGLSGSGKTTFLRCINRLIEPSSGRVLLDGQDVTAAKGEELRRLRTQIAMVFQQFNLVRRYSVLTNVLTGRLGYTPQAWSLFNRFRGSDVELAARSLQRVGLLEKAYNRADALSGGQQQRVGIARALMQQPKIIMADEPVASLDPVLSHSILRYLQEVNRADGITVICSLHIPSLFRRYATRVVALKAGRLVFDGAPGDLGRERFREIYGDEAEEVEID